MFKNAFFDTVYGMGTSQGMDQFLYPDLVAIRQEYLTKTVFHYQMKQMGYPAASSLSNTSSSKRREIVLSFASPKRTGPVLNANRYVFC
jgi:hypothetical protein